LTTTKAYKNLAFLNGRDARTLRILSEYLEPQSRFRHYQIQDTIVFFGSARLIAMDQARTALDEARAAGDAEAIRIAERDLHMARYYEEARTLAARMTEWSKELGDGARRFIVCSGGGPGIMEAANRGASEATGLSVGLGISLPMEPTHNPYITRELDFEFHYFFMRKFWFVYLSKAAVVFPGGYGTMDELFELLTLVQTGKLAKKIPIVLYGKEFWDEVLNLESLVRWGTISESDLDLIRVCNDPEETFAFLTETLKTLYLEEQPERD
jgi:uncharacterized protein (TIGR00730 family)